MIILRSPLYLGRTTKLVSVVLLAAAIWARSPRLASSAQAPPQFAIYLLGFDDQEHTSISGLQQNDVAIGGPLSGIGLNAIVGRSYRFSSTTNSQTGYSGWLFNATDQSTTRLGLLGPQYFPQGQHSTEPQLVNDVNQSVGVTSTDPTSSGGRNLAWFYDPSTAQTTRIGYSTLASSPNVWSDLPSFLQDDGFVTGYSSTGTSGAPYIAWAYKPDWGTTRIIGLAVSALPANSVGPASNRISAISGNDYVIGEVNGATSGPSVVWIYDPSANQSNAIGFYGSPYIDSEFSQTNATGLVAGYSIFPGASSQRSEAWLYDPALKTTVAVGFSNPTTGSQWTDTITALTDQNRIYGSSTDNVTIKPWIYDHSQGTTTAIGLTSGDYVQSNGGTVNNITSFTKSGFVLGSAKRALGALSTYNQTPWVYNPATGATIATGLNAGLYTYQNTRFAQGFQINEAGQAIGISTLYTSTGAMNRNSAWFFDPTTGATTEIAASVANAKKATFNTPAALNAVGQVAGVASNNSGKGDFVWLYDNRTKTVVSDFDVRNPFTAPTNGGADILIRTLTDTGLVLGQSTRFDPGDDEIGQTQWLYDSTSKMTYDLTFSQNSRTGAAFTDVVHLSDNGTMFGEYDAYNGSTYQGRRYFYWSIATGFYDLQSLIVGNLGAAGWSSLVDNSGLSPQLQFIRDGFLMAPGLRTNGNNMAFALVAVPEPSTLYLFMFSLLGFAMRSKRPR